MAKNNNLSANIKMIHKQVQEVIENSNKSLTDAHQNTPSMSGKEWRFEETNLGQKSLFVGTIVIHATSLLCFVYFIVSCVKYFPVNFPNRWKPLLGRGALFSDVSGAAFGQELPLLSEWAKLGDLSAVFGYIVGLLIIVFVLLSRNWMYQLAKLLYMFMRSFMTWAIASYEVARICLSSLMFSSIIFLVEPMFMRGLRVLENWSKLNADVRLVACLELELNKASSYDEWLRIGNALDIAMGKEEWKTSLIQDTEPFNYRTLSEMIHQLSKGLHEGNANVLVFHLSGLLKRNALGIDSPCLHLNCKSGTKQIIKVFRDLVVTCLEYLCFSEFEEFTKNDKIVFFKKCKKSFGCTALSLSGGGAIALYHLGVVKVMLEENVLPNVISGSSGGAISAAMLACKTNKECIEELIKSDIATRFKDNYGIVWFPSFIQQISHFWKTGVLVDCLQFERTTKQYYGEPLSAPVEEKTMWYTFQDAYKKTGRQVSITVSASEITGAKGPRKLLLNHVTTPNVLLWSAVAVTCSLPGIMKGKTLMARDSQGNVVPYLSMGEEWIDGSMHEDLPKDTLATTFNATNFIVSQVNPHVVPFVSIDVDHPSLRNSMFRAIEEFLTTDIRHRIGMLGSLGIFPKIYGQQFSQWFAQSFIGTVTITPNLIGMEAIGIKAISNPSESDLKRYLSGGARSAFPKIQYIKHLCQIEKCLDSCLDYLVSNNVHPEKKIYDNWLHPRNQGKHHGTVNPLSV